LHVLRIHEFQPLVAYCQPPSFGGDTVTIMSIK
jgi:hypothetical protein